MSEDSIKIISNDPLFIPSEATRKKAREFLMSVFPKADSINIVVEDEVVFIDQGENFEQVLCPKCNFELNDWWGEAMEKASKTNFSNLNVTVPCCQTQTSLNDLKYEWPAGFATFVLEVNSPNVDDISDNDLDKLEIILGSKLRKIYAHY